MLRASLLMVSALLISEHHSLALSSSAAIMKSVFSYSLP